MALSTFFMPSQCRSGGTCNPMGFPRERELASVANSSDMCPGYSKMWVWQSIIITFRQQLMARVDYGWQDILQPVQHLRRRFRAIIKIHAITTGTISRGNYFPQFFA